MPQTTVQATGHRPNIALKICLKCDASAILVGLHHVHAQLSISLSVFRFSCRLYTVKFLGRLRWNTTKRGNISSRGLKTVVLRVWDRFKDRCCHGSLTENNLGQKSVWRRWCFIPLNWYWCMYFVGSFMFHRATCTQQTLCHAQVY